MGKKQAISGPIRRSVCSRYGAALGRNVSVRCAYCDYTAEIVWNECAPSWPVLSGSLEFDHIVPESRGGPTTPENLTLACKPCNQRKGTKLWHASAQ